MERIETPEVTNNKFCVKRQHSLLHSKKIKNFKYISRYCRW